MRCAALTLALLACGERPPAPVPGQPTPGVELDVLIDLEELGLGNLKSLTLHPARPGLFAADRGTGVLLDAGLKSERVVRFEAPVTRVVPLPPDAPLGPGRFVDRGGGWQPVELFDDAGGVLWSLSSSPGGHAVDELGWTAMPEGGVEFWLVFNAEEGIQRLDEDGRVIATIESGDSCVEVIDDGFVRCFVTRGGHGIQWRDESGAVLNEVSKGRSFSLCTHPDVPGRTCVLAEEDGELYVYSDDGTRVDSYLLPEGLDFYHGTGAFFRSAAGSWTFAVALPDTKDSPGAVLLYDDRDELVHAEVFPTGNLTQVVALPEEMGGGAAFGWGSTIWRMTWTGER